MRGAVRTVEATPTAPPTAFFPCNLCAYLWPDICLPAAIYGGRDNSNKRAATPADWHWCAASDRFRHLGQSKTFQNLPTHQLSSPSNATGLLSCCCRECRVFGENGKSFGVDVLFPGHLRDSRSAAGLAAFRQINKFLFDGQPM